VVCNVAGGYFSTIPTVLVELNGIENIAKSMAICNLAIGTACLLASPFSGILQLYTCCFLRFPYITTHNDNDTVLITDTQYTQCSVPD